MTRILLLFMVSMIAFSCDIAKEDSIGKSATIDENPSSIFFTLPDANLTIDPRALENLKLANSLIMSKLPQNGEAKFIENGHVFYRSTNPQASNDAFTVTGKTSAGVAVSEEIKISYVTNQGALPCYTGTLGDKALAETGQSTEINVLANDRTCGVMDKNSLRIELQPKNGKASVINQKVVYTPNADFLGEDTFFYRVNINNNKNAVAPVEVNVSESKECLAGITDDIVNILSYTAGTDLVFDVLQNDKICSIYQKSTLRIIKNPATGTLRVGKNNANNDVIYFKSDTAPKGTQSFEYGLFRSEKLYVKANVTVNFN